MFRNEADEAIVIVAERESKGSIFSTRDLNPRNDLINHSPDGFEWGYGGSGPSQPALAMIADAFRTAPAASDDKKADALAIKYHHVIKEKMIAPLPQERIPVTPSKPGQKNKVRSVHVITAEYVIDTVNAMERGDL